MGFGSNASKPSTSLRRAAITSSSPIKHQDRYGLLQVGLFVFLSHVTDISIEFLLICQSEYDQMQLNNMRLGEKLDTSLDEVMFLLYHW